MSRHSIAPRLLAGALLGTACAAAPFECADEVVGADPSLDARVFVDALAAYLVDAGPKGAGFALGDARGELLARGGCGWSRDERGDRRAFTSRTHNNWGSVAKMITAAAAIHAVEHTPGASLDDPFADYLPARWRAALHPGHAQTTIRMLLQHRGGFGRDGEIYYLNDDGAVVDLLARRLASPPERTVGVRAYSNISPILLHFVVAFMTDPVGMAAIEAELEMTSSGDEFSRDINLAAAEVYVAHAQRHVLQPAGARGSCNITDFAGHAYSYDHGDSRNDGAYPRQAFGGDHTDECSAGGWIVDPEGMLAVLAALRHRGTIVSPAAYALMENTADRDDRLGYSNAYPVEGGVVFCHGGSYVDIDAAVCSFPGGAQAVVNVNSWTPGGSAGLVSALLDAYAQARRP